MKTQITEEDHQAISILSYDLYLRHSTLAPTIDTQKDPDYWIEVATVKHFEDKMQLGWIDGDTPDIPRGTKQ